MKYSNTQWARRGYSMLPALFLTAASQGVLLQNASAQNASAPGASVPGAPAPAIAAPDRFFFRNGDRPILFLGDSITEQRMYTNLIETYVLTRFPDWDVQFRNVGWSGDRAHFTSRGGYETGMKRDVLAFKPAAVLINFGMNDARSGDAGYSNYIDYSTRLVRDLKAIGARVALLTPNPEERYEANQPGGSAYNTMLWKYSQGLREVAAKEGALFVDQYSPFITTIANGRANGVLSSEAGGARLIPDGVHPNWAGHLVTATHVLKGLGAPSVVSRIEVDGSASKLLLEENARLDTPARSRIPADLAPGSLMFVRTDKALPWPIPDDAALALRIPGFKPVEDLNRYELRVTNLTAPRYDVLIDGEKVSTHSRQELAQGINLARQAGPITAQAQRLMKRVQEKNNLYFARWRQTQVFTAPTWLQGEIVETARAAELARLDAQIAEAEKEIDNLRKPVPHLWQISPAMPAAPTDVAIDTTSGSINLRWRYTPGDEQGFLVERSLDGTRFTSLARLSPNVMWISDQSIPVSRTAYYRVRAFNANGNSEASSTVSNAWNGNGLRAEYFNGTGFDQRILTRIDRAIDFDWQEAAPATGINTDNFSVRWTGQLQTQQTGDYRFTALSDDGVRVWVNNRLVIDNWQNQAPTEVTGLIALEAGRKYDFKIEYYDSTGGATMKLFWQAPGQKREVVPSSQLYPAL